MGYGFPLKSATRIETLGVSTGEGTIVTSGATAGSFGTLTTIGTTGFAYDGFLVNVKGVTATRQIKFTITAAAGGGSDVTIADSLTYYSMRVQPPGVSIYVPVAVPALATLKVQQADNFGSTTAAYSIVGFAGGARLLKGGSRIVSLTDFGSGSSAVMPANTITLNGTTTTSWVTICASTSADIVALWATVGATSNTGMSTTGASSVDIGYGSGPTAIASYPVNHQSTTYPTMFGPLPISLPAGTALKARATASNANTGTYGPVFWGLAA